MNPVLGPDATSVGWGFSYALVDETGGHDLSQLRSLQDWNVKLALESVPGVSQVASVGGFVKQYQIMIDPNRLSAYNLPLMKVIEAVRKSNQDVEGRVIELSGTEYMVRGRGYIKSLQDIENISSARTASAPRSSCVMLQQSSSAPRSGGGLRNWTARARSQAASLSSVSGRMS